MLILKKDYKITFYLKQKIEFICAYKAKLFHTKYFNELTYNEINQNIFKTIYCRFCRACSCCMILHKIILIQSLEL